MRNIVRKLMFQASALVMSVVMVFVVFLPMGASAAKQMSNGHSGQSGDPIDGNDYGGGCGGGVDDYLYQDQNSAPAGGSVIGGRLVLPFALDGIRIMVVPGFQNGMFTVQFVILPAAVDHLEAPHAE